MKKFACTACLLSLVFITQASFAAGNPAALLTRAEAVAILLQARTPTLPQIANVGQFPDVQAGQWYEKYMLAGQRFGIVTADSKGLLHPEGSVSRAAFTKMITLTFGLTTHTTYTYSDIPAYAWFAPYIGIASRYRLFASDTDSSLFHPDNPISYDEAKLALQSMVNNQAIPSNIQPLISADQAKYKLKIYQTISTTKAEYVRLPASESDSSSSQPALLTALGRPNIAAIKDRIVQLVNEQRLKKNLSPLHPDMYLMTSAQKYSDAMMAQGFFGHISPSGETLQNRMENSGYYNPALEKLCACVRRYVVGENIARGQKTAEEVMDAWMKSPSHRDAIMNPSFTEIGIGVSAGIWVEHFGGMLDSSTQ